MPPMKVRLLWQSRASDEAKRNRQGIKYRPEMATRFLKIGGEDPRVQTRKTR